MKTRIKQDIKEAMISKDTVARDVLRVLIGEIERSEQTLKGKIKLSDTDIVTIVKKMVMNIKEMNGDLAEAMILSNYLPRQLTQARIEDIIDTFIIENSIDDMKGMGRIMGYFSKNFPNQYDGKLVSILIREVLQ